MEVLFSQGLQFQRLQFPPVADFEIEDRHFAPTCLSRFFIVSKRREKWRTKLFGLRGYSERVELKHVASVYALLKSWIKFEKKLHEIKKLSVLLTVLSFKWSQDVTYLNTIQFAFCFDTSSTLKPGNLKDVRISLGDHSVQG